MPEGPPARYPRRRVVFWVSSLAASLGLAWFSPFSPLAIERAEFLHRWGHTDAAVVHLDRAASVHPIGLTRARALHRAGSLLALELRRPSDAKLRWMELTRQEDIPPMMVADAWAQIAHLERVTFDAPDRAAAAFLQAADHDRDGPMTHGWLAEAALALEKQGDLDRAHQAWDTLARRFPDARARARLHQAALLLGKGKVAQAEELYQDAIISAKDEVQLHMARLGSEACRARLARVEEALAEIESDELDPALLELRRVQLSEGEQGPSDDL